MEWPCDFFTFFQSQCEMKWPCGFFTFFQSQCEMKWPCGFFNNTPHLDVPPSAPSSDTTAAAHFCASSFSPSLQCSPCPSSASPVIHFASLASLPCWPRAQNVSLLPASSQNESAIANFAEPMKPWKVAACNTFKKLTRKLAFFSVWFHHLVDFQSFSCAQWTIQILEGFDTGNGITLPDCFHIGDISCIISICAILIRKVGSKMFGKGVRECVIID